MLMESLERCVVGVMWPPLPLAPVLGSAAGTPEREAAADAIRRRARWLLRLFNSLRDSAKELLPGMTPADGARELANQMLAEV